MINKNTKVKIRPLTIPGKEVFLDGAVYIPENSNSKIVIFCHGLPKGIPSNDNDNDPGYSGLAQSFAKEGYASVIFNFRGTGKSTGSLEVAKWPDDLISVMDFLDKDKELSKTYYSVVGFSTGAAAAIFAGTMDSRMNPLVLCAAPADFSILGIRENQEAYFEHYKSVDMIKPEYKHDSFQWAKNFGFLEGRKAMPHINSENVLIVHGLLDDTVPADHAKALLELSPAKTELLMLQSAGHHLRREPKAVKAVLDYLARKGANAADAQDI